MDYSKTPEVARPENLYAAMSFDAVNRVFRDGKAFNSHIYDTTISLFIGPTILAMEGKEHREHRNLVSAAFKSRSLLRWEPEIVRPVVNALIDDSSTQAGRSRPRFHVGVPDPGDLEAAGAARGGPAVVPQARGGADQLPRQVRAGL